jgi:hypothetical protein
MEWPSGSVISSIRPWPSLWIVMERPELLAMPVSEKTSVLRLLSVMLSSLPVAALMTRVRPSRW